MDALNFRLRPLALVCAVAALFPAPAVLANPGTDATAPERSDLADRAFKSRTRWRSHIEEASRRFGVPADWIERVMMAESGGRTELGGRPITSHAGAMGLMQLMPGTWAEMRRRLALGRDPHDPRDNIFAGTLYLRMMHDRFGYPGLFGAYNAGPARYAAYLDGRQSLPAETRSYIRKVARRDASGFGRTGDPSPTRIARRPAIGDRSAAPVGGEREPRSEDVSDLFFIRR